jgi:hypothetical protein
MPKGKVTATDGKMILAWRGNNEGDGYGYLSDRFGVSDRTISKWIKKVNNDPDLLAKAKSKDKVTANANNISSRAKRTPNGKVIKGSPSGAFNFSSTRSSKKKKVSPKTVKDDLAYTAKLEDEIAFMKWWNNGERNGYVERLLKALEQG